MKGHSLFSSHHSSPSHHTSPSHHSSPSHHTSPSHHSSHSPTNRTHGSSPSSTPSRFSDTTMVENIDGAESIILKWELPAHKEEEFKPLFVDDRKEAKNFLEAVASLQSAMHYYLKLSSSSEKLVRAQRLMHIAIKRLEKEFHVILSANRKNLDSESVSGHSRASAGSSISDFNEDEVSEEGGSATPGTPTRTSPSGGGLSSDVDVAMADLKSIAECMIGSGYAKECVHIYQLIRKSIVDEAMYYLKVEKLNSHQMQKMEWNVLEAKIKTWLHAVKTAVKTLFYGEKILCDAVFASSERIAESCFGEICREAAVNLFSFAENFGKSKKILSPEKTFRALDLYQAIFELWPEIEAIFWHESVAAARAEAEAALVKLGEAVRTMLAQFEAAMQKDSSKTPPGGGVHPLTRYVMNFLVFLGDYSGAVSDILADWTSHGQSPLPESYFSSPTSGGGEDPSAAAITARLAWLILVLLCKLDAKAALYNDAALSYLFLANNLNYVVLKVRNSNLGLLMGADWVLTNRAKVNRFLSNYERMGWAKVISSLPQDPTAEIPPQQVKECFKNFNQSFEETYKKQDSWVIPDPVIRDEVKISLAKKLVPGYRIFYQTHRGTANHGMGMGEETIVRYAPEDLNNYLSDLFLQASGTSTTSSLLSWGH